MSLSDYVTRWRQEEPLRLLTGLMDTDETVVQRQSSRKKGLHGPGATGPPETSWSGPRGTTFFVDGRVGMVKPEEACVPPVVENFSDAALAPSQAENLRNAFEKTVLQNGDSTAITMDIVIRLFRSWGIWRPSIAMELAVT